MRSKFSIVLLWVILCFIVSCEKKPAIIISDLIEWSYVDKNLGPSYCSSDGTIYAGDASSGDIYRSMDDGVTWVKLYKIENGASTVRCIFVSNRGTIFASRDYTGELIKSDDLGKTFKPCLKLSDNQASVVWRMAENRKGWLFAAEYANKDWNEKCAYIYRSKNDGNDWDTIYHDSNARHFHFVAVDPYSDYIYAASGDGEEKQSLIRSVDGGDNWETLGNNSMNPEIDWQFTSVVFTPNYRILGEDEPPQSDIVRTADDIHFERVLIPEGPEKHNFWSWGRRDERGNILFGSWTQHDAIRGNYKNIPSKANGVIYLSRDEGATWEKVLDLGLYKKHSGTHFASNVKDGSWIFIHIKEDGKSLKIHVK